MCVQGDRGSRRCLEDDAPGDAELGAEVVGAGGKDDAADSCVGECTGQVGDGAHRGLQLTVVAGCNVGECTEQARAGAHLRAAVHAVGAEAAGSILGSGSAVVASPIRGPIARVCAELEEEQHK